jgi:hypothetical protein
MPDVAIMPGLRKRGGSPDGAKRNPLGTRRGTAESDCMPLNTSRRGVQRHPPPG